MTALPQLRFFGAKCWQEAASASNVEIERRNALRLLRPTAASPSQSAWMAPRWRSARPRAATNSDWFSAT